MIVCCVCVWEGGGCGLKIYKFTDQLTTILNDSSSPPHISLSFFFCLQPDRKMDRGWAVIRNVDHPSKSPCIVFYQDNLREKTIMKKEKIELATVRCVTQIFNHPKHPNSFCLRMKGSKRLILNADNGCVCCLNVTDVLYGVLMYKGEPQL